MSTTPPIKPAEFKVLRDYIEQHCGISLSEDKSYLVDTRLSSIVVEAGCTDFAGLHQRALIDPTKQLRDRMIDAMTTNETLWFRDQHPFTILREKLIPPLAAELRGGTRRQIRIWSAASSTGQEPYSIAIAVRELCRTEAGLRPEMVEIVATDISPTVLKAARSGLYDNAALQRGMPPDLKARYFRHEGEMWLVDEEIRDMVRFEEFNLQDSPARLGRFDIVFCRYVAIYFSETMKKKLYARIADAVGPGGHLIISAIENLRGLSTRFEPQEHAGGSYYRCS